jgi:putative sporulation protein YtxC
LFFLKRKNIIVRRLIEYFEGSDELILKGFVTFRLKDYINELEEVVDRAVDDYLTEREYKEFIRLLKYFVEIQEPKFDTVHILAEYSGKYSLLDNNENEITNECIRDFVNEVNEGEINYDDLLVSSLITLAPKKIIIHNMGQIGNKELLETIKSIFPNKISVCEICHLCSDVPLNIRKSESRLSQY